MAASSEKLDSKWILLICLLTLAKGVLGSSFYDKGSVSLDATNHKKARINLPDGKAFAFYGGRYSSIWLTTDGFLSFDERAEYGSVDFSTGDVTPSYDYPIIAPFFHNGEALDVHTGAGTIYYRTLNTSHDGTELNMFGTNISNAVVGFQNFQPVGGIIVTWESVADAFDVATTGCGAPPTATPCKTSTFQAAILTDERSFTFAIFNYDQMNIDIRRYYQSGFNAGYGGGWTTAVPQSELNRAQSLKGSDVYGRYYFRICADRIVRGGCRDRSLPTDNVMLEMSPNFGGMYGGQTIEMSGSCLLPNEKVTCMFGQVSSSGIYINSMKTKCNVPRLLERGRVTVSMSHGAGRVYSGVITIVSPGRMKDTVKSIDIPGSGWNTTDAGKLTMTWDSSLLSNQRNDLVTIKLIGYRESGMQAEWVELAVLGSGINVMNNGVYTFNTRDHRCSGDLCNVETGLVEVRLADPSRARSHLFVVSRELPLGWYVNNNMVQRYGSQWPHDKCMLWYNNDRLDMSWMRNLPNCPCNLGQALVDIGRFQTDPGCDMFSGSVCTYHTGAVHCVRAVKPTSEGSGNQCCYGPDGALRYAADTFQGSTPDRSHAWGAFPYGRTDLVPSMSHWVKDVVTFYYCCLWTNYGDCDYYMDQRATRDCRGYTPPRAATVYGQGHVVTLDNLSYRVYGAGDFKLLESRDITIQGRFSRKYYDTFRQDTYKTLNASVILTSIGIKVGQEKVEIKLDRNSPQRMLNVLVNNTFQFFDTEPVYMQQFSQVTIVNSPNKAGNINSNFTVILKNGMGVQAVASSGLMNVVVMVPYTLKGQVKGLLGTWNDNGTDDFTPSDTNQPITLTDNPTFYNQFTYSWRVNNSGVSILPHFVPPKTPSDLVDYVPFTMTTQSMFGVCNAQENCEFDYQQLNVRTQAAQTKMAAYWFGEIQSLVTPVRSCGLLNVPRSTKDNYNYSLGSTVTVTGCRTGDLAGTSTYSCQATSNVSQAWSPSVSAVCTNTPLDEADIGMIVGIVIACVALLPIAVIIALVLRRRARRDKSPSAPDEGGAYSADSPNPVSSGDYDARYSEVKRRDEDDAPREKHKKSKEFDM